MHTLARRTVPLVVAGVLLVSTAATAAPPTWTPTWTQTPQRLPVDRVGLSSHHATAYSVDCVTAAYCVVVGSYDTDDPSLPYRGFLDTEANGTAFSIAAPLPANARGGPYLAYVSCPAVEQCVAVGRYTNRSGYARPLIETQSGRQWVPQTLRTRILDHVACTTTVCAASSSDDIGDGVLAVRNANGHWRVPDIAAPAGMDILWIDDLSCAASSCYAIGTAAPTSGGPVESVVVLPDGANYRAVPAAQPIGVTDPVRLTGMACPNATTCYAIGQAGPAREENHLVIETLAGQHLTASEPRLPKVASSDPPLHAGRIACAANGFCAATAGYGPAEPENEIDGDGDLLLTRHGSNWRTVVAPVPGNLSLSELSTTGVSCASASCTVVGEIGSHASRRAFTATYAAGAWTPQVLPVPTWARSSGGTATELGAVDCADDGCLATGIFDVYSGTHVVDGGALLARD